MTPGYSPPEQYGTARTDPRSDVYSLGATLYMSLTGILPEDALAQAMGQIELTHIRKHNSKVSRRLAAVIEKAMEIQPEHRYQNVEEFKKALVNTRVITGRNSVEEATLTPANKSVVGGMNAGSERPGGIEISFDGGSPLLPVNDSGVEFASKGFSGWRLNRRIGCWLIAAFIILITTAVIGGAYLFQPELISRAVSWFNSNVAPTSLSIGVNTPTTESGLMTATSGKDTPNILAGGEGSKTPTSTLPSLTPTIPLGANTPTVKATKPPRATATFTPSPTPLGGGAGQIAYASDLTGIPQIWIMNADGTAPHLITDMQEGACQPDWSPSGEQLAFISPCAGNQETYPGAGIFTINSDGTGVIGLPSVPGGDFDPQWSPDGKTITFTSLRDYNRAQVYEFNLEDESVRSLSANTVRDSQAAYSPDGMQLAFVTTRRGPYQIWTMNKDGGEAILLSRSGSLKDTHPEWSPDGTVIMFTQTELLGGVPRLVAMRVEEGNLIESRVIRELIPMREAAYSPDGAWIAFESWPEGMNHDIFVMTPNGSARQRLTDDEANNFDPDWRP
jgi:Tol biopolymer transport system component